MRGKSGKRSLKRPLHGIELVITELVVAEVLIFYSLGLKTRLFAANCLTFSKMRDGSDYRELIEDVCEEDFVAFERPLTDQQWHLDSI